MTLKESCYKIWKEFRPKIVFYFNKGYTKEILIKDFFAGTTVAIVAFPLAMALAIASGVGPERGLYTAIIAGFLISFLGGSRVQIGGPTGAFVVIVFDIVMRQGYQGLVIATIMAGFFLIIMGFLRFGALIKYIPYPVITGFTTGIALIIFSSQLKDFFGIPSKQVSADFISQILFIYNNISSINIWAFLISFVSIGIILGAKFISPKVPAHIIAVAFGAFLVWFFQIPVETIESRFGSIPSMLPTPTLPNFSFTTIKSLIPDAFTIALLAAIESLLCAVVADGMIGGKLKSNTELVAQGVANISSALFGGIPATGAIARTATNIKSGAQTPLAGIIHSLILFLFMIVFTPFIVKIPMATLAAILVIVAWNMSEIEQIAMLSKAPKTDVALLTLTFLLTVFVNLNTAVQMGVMISLFLFVRKLTSITSVKNLRNINQEQNSDDLDDSDAPDLTNIPKDVDVYEFSGPLFYGVADRLKTIFEQVMKTPKVFILRMGKVPFIDATGMIALVDFHKRCKQDGTHLYLCEIGEDLHKDLENFGYFKIIGPENVFDSLDRAIKKSKDEL